MVKTRESNHNKLYSLLNEYCLADRIFTDFSAMEKVAGMDIDWDIVNGEVEARRRESMAFLDMMIEFCK